MKFFQSLTLLFVASIAGILASPVARQVQRTQYETCPYPRHNITVINFEYTENQKLYDHRGLDFFQWSGFKRYYGYGIDGWSPNPSNYTTAHYTSNGRESWKLGFQTGPRASLKYVHSFWFYLGFIGSSNGAVPIEIYGSGGQYTVIWTDPYHDGFWEHVCLDWEVEGITIVVPNCWEHTKGCESSVFELDDIWVNGGPHEPIREVKEPVLEYD